MKNSEFRVITRLVDVHCDRAGYEVHLANGEVKMFTWTELHVDLKTQDRVAYDTAKWRWAW